MCYVLAKDRNKHGCVALKTQIGKPLSALKRELNALAPRGGIEIVVISRLRRIRALLLRPDRR